MDTLKTILSRARFQISFERYARKNKSDLGRNLALKNMDKRDCCFIVGNGPSITNFDFSTFEDEDIFTVNQIARHGDFSKAHPKIHFWADPLFFAENKDGSIGLSDEVFSIMVKTIESNSATRFILVKPFSNSVCSYLVRRYGIERFFRYLAITDLGDPRVRKWTLSLDRPCPSFYNVVQYAIWSAMCLGYSRIYLIGCEQSYIKNEIDMRLSRLADESIYGYTLSDKEKSRISNSAFATNLADVFSSYARIFRDFQLLKQVSDQNNISIINCTPNSLIDCFPKKTLEEVLGERRKK